MPTSPSLDRSAPARFQANLQQFQQDVAQFQRGTQQFQTDVRQLQAEIQTEMANIRSHVAPLRHLAPPTHPQSRHNPQLNQAQQAALSQFLDRGSRLWYWTSHGLIFIGTFVIGNAILHPFEPWLRAWIDHLLGR
ncbi:hypothetical protein RIF25_15040 [Thermosynechococcaceae cyanobacterium BACA0444]|uniref:Uncharacterized protein n=1 Tax=Pseudocalidococcus azoricus BACA0444 TaxID=2918990 RepID=A0AAE4FV46_9CYAN|nr:hypothetical protein [Pseudocalidococcus azoricus]MDS3862117.1 hypothetical protein [Pseudocalidococcus azoricus BACA0444]